MNSNTTEEEEFEFANYLGQMANMCVVTHAIGLGSRLGIFEVMAELEKPQKCDQIALKGGWKKRYIQEWLGLMSCGKIVEYNKDDGTFYIPKHRLPSLLSSGEHGQIEKLTSFMQGIRMVMRVEEELASCFLLDGPSGIPYSSFPRFHEWRTMRTEEMYNGSNIKSLLGQVPNLLEKLEKGINVIDAGCSVGHQVRTCAEQFPNSNFIGFDIDEGVVKDANQKCKKQMLHNISFRVEDAVKMPREWSNQFDLLMVWDVVHDIPHPKKFLASIVQILKPGGVFLMIDVHLNSDLGHNIGLPYSTLFYGLSLFHCLPISLYFEGSEGLGNTWGIEKQQEYLIEAGFKDILQLKGPNKTQTYFAAYKPS